MISSHKISTSFLFSSWLSVLWNGSVVPAVNDALKRGSSSMLGVKDSAGMMGGVQQKVVSTALYVVLQRAVVQGCPLSGSGTEALNYFQLFD